MYKVEYFKRIIRHYFSITIEAAGVKDPDCIAEIDGALDGIGEVIEGQATALTQALERIDLLEKRADFESRITTDLAHGITTLAQKAGLYDYMDSREPDPAALKSRIDALEKATGQGE